MKKKIIAFIAMLISVITIGLVVSQASSDVIDYKDQKPNDITKPNAGMRIIIKHQDGSSDQVETASNAYPTGYAKVGDTVEIRDISDVSKYGTRLLKWDFQYVTPSGREVARKMSASQYGQIDTLTLNEAGTYEFYLSVMDDAKTEDPKYKDWWKNWSENGIHRAKKKLANGKEYWCYFVSISIEVEEETPPPDDENVYLDAKMGGPNEVEKYSNIEITNTSTINGMLWSEFLAENPDWSVSTEWYYVKPVDSEVQITRSPTNDGFKAKMGEQIQGFHLKITLHKPSGFTGDIIIVGEPDNIDPSQLVRIE